MHIGVLLLMTLATVSTFAHPGRTASDGCHYCRTRCDYWGQQWDARHCHGGGTAHRSAPKSVEYAKKPTPEPVQYVEHAPPVQQAPVPVVAEEPEIVSPEPEKEVVAEVESTKEPSDKSSGSPVGTVAVAGGGYYLYRKIKKTS